MNRILCILLFLWVVANTNAIGYTKISKSIKQGEVIDLTFKANSAQPFKENCTAVFLGPNHQEIKLKAFYNGNQEYVIRFSAFKPGVYTFKTNANHKKLNKLSGTITVIKNGNLNYHGAIVIDPQNPRKFAYADGKSYNLMAFELDWLFAMDYGKTELSDAKKLIGTIKANGFNQVVMNVFAYDIAWIKDKTIDPKYNYGQPKFFPFGGNNSKPDFSLLNTAYFKHLDKIIQLLKDEGIVSHLMIYVWNKKVNWPDMNSEGDNMYFDYVVNRYQAYENIVWDISKEALYYGRADMNYITDRIHRLRNNDAYHRLVSVHDFKYCANNPKEVDFISTQDWSIDLASKMKANYKQFIDKPIFNIEHGGYEKGPYTVFNGHYNNAEACLKRNYECAFQGVYSTYYWQNTSWNVIIPDVYDKSISPQPKLNYFKHFTEFFNKYDFKTLKPFDMGSEGTMALKDDKGTYLLYCPQDNYAIGTNFPDKINSAKSITCFNPINGDYKLLVKEDIINEFSWLIPPATGFDRILIIEF